MLICCIAPSQDWYYFNFKTMFLDYNRPICYSRLEIIYQNCIFLKFHGRSYHGMALGAIWNIWNLPGAPVDFEYSILKCSSALGAQFSSACNTSKGVSKYINILKNFYPTNFQHFPKLCITVNTRASGIQDKDKITMKATNKSWDMLSTLFIYMHSNNTQHNLLYLSCIYEVLQD